MRWLVTTESWKLTWVKDYQGHGVGFTYDVECCPHGQLVQLRTSRLQAARRLQSSQSDSLWTGKCLVFDDVDVERKFFGTECGEGKASCRTDYERSLWFHWDLWHKSALKAWDRLGEELLVLSGPLAQACDLNGNGMGTDELKSIIRFGKVVMYQFEPKNSTATIRVQYLGLDCEELFSQSQQDGFLELVRIDDKNPTIKCNPAVISRPSGCICPGDVAMMATVALCDKICNSSGRSVEQEKCDQHTQTANETVNVGTQVEQHLTSKPRAKTRTYIEVSVQTDAFEDTLQKWQVPKVDMQTSPIKINFECVEKYTSVALQTCKEPENMEHVPATCEETVKDGAYLAQNFMDLEAQLYSQNNAMTEESEVIEFSLREEAAMDAVMNDDVIQPSEVMNRLSQTSNAKTETSVSPGKSKPDIMATKVNSLSFGENNFQCDDGKPIPTRTVTKTPGQSPKAGDKCNSNKTRKGLLSLTSSKVLRKFSFSPNFVPTLSTEAFPMVLETDSSESDEEIGQRKAFNTVKKSRRLSLSSESDAEQQIKSSVDNVPNGTPASVTLESDSELAVSKAMEVEALQAAGSETSQHVTKPSSLARAPGVMQVVDASRGPENRSALITPSLQALLETATSQENTMEFLEGGGMCEHTQRSATSTEPIDTQQLYKIDQVERRTLYRYTVYRSDYQFGVSFSPLHFCASGGRSLDWGDVVRTNTHVLGLQVARPNFLYSSCPSTDHWDWVSTRRQPLTWLYTVENTNLAFHLMDLAIMEANTELESLGNSQQLGKASQAKNDASSVVDDHEMLYDDIIEPTPQKVSSFVSYRVNSSTFPVHDVRSPTREQEECMEDSCYPCILPPLKSKSCLTLESHSATLPTIIFGLLIRVPGAANPSVELLHQGYALPLEVVPYDQQATSETPAPADHKTTSQQAPQSPTGNSRAARSTWSRRQQVRACDCQRKVTSVLSQPNPVCPMPRSITSPSQSLCPVGTRRPHRYIRDHASNAKHVIIIAVYDGMMRRDIQMALNTSAKPTICRKPPGATGLTVKGGALTQKYKEEPLPGSSHPQWKKPSPIDMSSAADPHLRDLDEEYEPWLMPIHSCSFEEADEPSSDAVPDGGVELSHHDRAEVSDSAGKA
ncbi:hypothetical protein PR048_014260 [Dryococelus australis]|uniref:Uncharacterized protein n=1 Tax=Dryococelus australis TaxID=614101 RepID=A0ABQ9HDN9_9NEOP|nr:hypothetical protein PR048_014260 [Dryococelus australis]